MATEVKNKLEKEEKVGVLSYTGSKITKPVEKTHAKEECC